MRITMPRSDLARLLAATTRVVESRNTIPVLSTVRLVADGGKLTATATDLDIEIQSSVAAEAEEDGAFCVSAKLLEDIVKKLPPLPDVTLAEADGVLTVKSGRYTSRLHVLPVTDFPSFSVDGLTSNFDVDLAALFAPCSFAISTEETRYYLNGIYLAGDGNALTAVATDGHRLARHTVEGASKFEGVIIPRKMVGLVPKGAVSVSLSNAKIRITAGETVITSKLIDGSFPDYERVIPKGNDKIVTFGSDDMRRATDRVAVVSSERARAVKLSFADNLATLTVNSPDSGTATEEVSVSYDGEPVEVCFDASYLNELVGQFPAGDVKLALTDGGSPTVFTSDKAPELLCVLMPRRV